MVRVRVNYPINVSWLVGIVYALIVVRVCGEELDVCLGYRRCRTLI